MAPSTNWKEQILPGEAELHSDHLKAFEEVKKIKEAKYGKGRLLHRKMSLGLKARFEVLSGLPEYARYGLFAAPATYDALVRLSNGGMDYASDKKPDIRGFAVKVQGLQAPGALGSGNTDCQDFLMIQRSAFGFATSKDFVGFVRNAARGPLGLFKYLFTRYGFIGGFQKLKTFADAVNQPFSGFASEKFYTAAPIACGPYAVRVRMLPARTVANPMSETNWSADFKSHLAKGGLTFELQLQFFVDEQNTPIEDATKEWPENIAPFVTVGRLTIPTQDTDSSEGKKITESIDSAAFDPWNALTEHRPLGEVMRARKPVYYMSQTARKS